MASRPFRFDVETHTYWDEHGVEIPHITGLLTLAGWVNDEWYTEESCERGRIVHELTALYDMGAIGVADYSGPFRGYLLAHIESQSLYKPRWQHVELQHAHHEYRFAGTPDRVGQVFGAGAVVEIKSGGIEKGHAIQTALQAILVADELHLPADAIRRYAEYVGADGGHRFYEHDDRRDFAEARRILKEYC